MVRNINYAFDIYLLAVIVHKYLTSYFSLKGWKEGWRDGGLLNGNICTEPNVLKSPGRIIKSSTSIEYKIFVNIISIME